jgi:Protein of unknown function (DUF3096)
MTGKEPQAVPVCSPDSELRHKGNKSMTVTTLGIAHIQPIVSLIAGILILIMPRLLNYIVAIFLIVSGILGLGLIR